MPERMQFTVKMGRQTQRHQAKGHGNGLTIVMLGAFDGVAERGDAPEDVPTVLPIDIDTFDNRMEKLQPSTTLTLDDETGQSINIRLANLDDFHPEQLLEQLAPYLSATAKEPATDESRHGKRTDEGTTETESSQDTLSRLLGARPLSVEQNRTEGSSLSSARKSMIQEVVQRIAENASGEQDGESSESRTGLGHENLNQTRLLRKVLRDDAFRALEASWRGLDWLIHASEPDPGIRFYILNMPRSELERERASHENPTTSQLYRILKDLLERDGLSGSELLLLDQHQYTLNPDEIGTLEWLGSLAGNFDGSLLAAADPSFMTEDESSDGIKAWQTFRQGIPATRIVLLYPQVLLRLPYGSQTDPVHGFDFEELDEGWSVDDLLWGNPVHAASILLIRRWMELEDEDQPMLLTDLPAYTYKCDGESELQPCTKTLLREPEIDQLLKLGLVPVIGNRNSNSIRIPWYQYTGSSSGR